MTMVDRPRADPRTSPLPGIAMSIGDVALVTGLTIRAIRYYEERGLVEPRRDRNRARCYDPEAREKLNMIARLRACGLSLYDVEDVLEDGGGSKLATLLSAHREKLSRRLEVVDDLLVQLDDGRTGWNGSC